VSDYTEPTAWAIVGRATGRVRSVTTDEDWAREEAEYYDVWPLFRRQGPITDALIELANQLDDEENGAGYGSGEPHPVAVRIRSALAADRSEQ
jgi:hypothetical protein